MIESAHRAESDKRTAIPEIELYNSGTSRHMSPHCQRFTTYRPISPRPILAASKGVFYAIGASDLQVEVPKWAKSTPIMLR